MILFAKLHSVKEYKKILEKQSDKDKGRIEGRKVTVVKANSVSFVAQLGVFGRVLNFFSKKAFLWVLKKSNAKKFNDSGLKKKKITLEVSDEKIENLISKKIPHHKKKTAPHESEKESSSDSKSLSKSESEKESSSKSEPKSSPDSKPLSKSDSKKESSSKSEPKSSPDSKPLSKSESEKESSSKPESKSSAEFEPLPKPKLEPKKTYDDHYKDFLKFKTDSFNMKENFLKDISPFHYVAFTNNIDFLEMLMDRGENINTLDADGFTALDLLIKHERDLESPDILLETERKTIDKNDTDLIYSFLNYRGICNEESLRHLLQIIPKNQIIAKKIIPNLLFYSDKKNYPIIAYEIIENKNIDSVFKVDMIDIMINKGMSIEEIDPKSGVSIRKKAEETSKDLLEFLIRRQNIYYDTHKK